MATKAVLTFKGFDDLLETIKEADGEIKPSVEKALKAGADEVTAEIRQGFEKHGISTNPIIEPEVKWDGNVASAEIGWKVGSYNAKNPSDGMKALFIEFGTATRQTKESEHVNAGGRWVTTRNRGAVKAEPFFRPAIENAKKANSKNKKAQKAALNEILKGLKQ